jgi:hypothetical protein
MFGWFKKKKTVNKTYKEAVDELIPMCEEQGRIIESLKRTIERYKEVVKIQEDTIKCYESVVTVAKNLEELLKLSERESDGSGDKGTD